MANDSDDPVEIADDEPDEPNESKAIQSQGNGDTNSTCMICMEEWTIGSAHRVCCLKCGHLFGRSCIERWIKEKGNSNAKCPNCSKPAKRVDIRDIWCKTIVAYDSTELAELQRQIEVEREHYAREKACNFQLKQINNQLFSEMENLKTGIMERDRRIHNMEALLNKLNKMRSDKLSADGLTSNDITVLDLNNIEMEQMEQMVNVVEQKPQELKGRFYYGKNVESHPGGGCKSMTICPISAEIIIAQPLPPGNPRLGNDYGVRKYSLLDTTCHSFIYLHSLPLTSVHIKPFGDLILTSGQDRKIHLTSTSNSRRVQTYDCLYEPHCVSWSVHRDQQFYVTSKNCYISLYDMRNTSEYIYQKSQRIARTAMVSMASVAYENGLQGVIANDAKGCQFLEINDSSSYDSEVMDHEIDHLKVHQLPFRGLMGTVDHNQKTGHTLITTRRSEYNSNTIHNLVKCKLVDSNDGTQRVECENIRTFHGGRAPDLLSHSRILRHPTLEQHVLVGACDDSARGIKLWDASDNTEYQKLPTPEFVRDMVLFTPENTNQHMLFTLHDKGFGVYRWDYA